MFDLKQSITAWREQMLAAGIQSPVPLEELEIHLREEIQHQVDQGFSESEAFERSVQGIGQPKTIKREFQKDDENLMKMILKIGMGLLEIALGFGMTVPAAIEIRRELQAAAAKLALMLLGMFLISRGSDAVLKLIRSEVPGSELENVEMTRSKQIIKTGAGIACLLFGAVLILPSGLQACQKGMVEFEAVCWLVFGVAMLMTGCVVTFSPYKKRTA